MDPQRSQTNRKQALTPSTRRSSAVGTTTRKIDVPIATRTTSTAIPGLPSDVSSPIDDRPIAVHKKRRASTTGTSSNKDDVPGTDDSITMHHLPKTPARRTRKRVRFSDPTELLDREASNSTGITPFVRRIRLSPHPGSPLPEGLPQAQRSTTPARSSSRPKRQGTPSRRRSMPAISTSSPSDLSMLTSINVRQFTPLRQILDDRIKRRLKRNHLSEELNAVEKEMRLVDRQEQQIRTLKEELAAAKGLGELAAEMHGPNEYPQRVQELENEISKLRDELSARLTTPAPMTPSEMQDDGNDAVMMFEPSSPCPTVPLSSDFGSVPATPMSTTFEPRTPSPTTNSAGVQTSFTTPMILDFESRITEQTTHLVAARLELENLCPGETPLPLSPTPDADVSPLLQALVAHLRSAKASNTQIKRQLAASETQQSNLRTQFNTSLAQLESARSRARDLQADLDTTTTVFRAGCAKTAELEKEKADTSIQLRSANDQIQTLQKDAWESERSINALTAALEKYRAEAKEFEGMIMRLEDEHAAAMGKMDAQHAQVVSNLEAHVAAETRGRQEAQHETGELGVRVKAAEQARKELVDAVNAKQRILRELESCLDTERAMREQEVGALNVRLANTQGRLGDLEEQIRTEKRRTCEVVDRVVEGARVADGQAVRDIMSDSNGDQIGLGLLTPRMEGGRYHDVLSGHIDGNVEMRRGKASKKRKNPDSGIGILEEDESEFLSSDI